MRMMSRVFVLFGAVGLAVTFTSGCYGDNPQFLKRHALWESYYTEGKARHQQGAYDDAERLLRDAVAEAERLRAEDLKRVEQEKPAHDTRLAATLDELATLYGDQGRFVKAEALYQRALKIDLDVYGPEHPSVARTLEHYAALLRTIDRMEEAGVAE